MKKKRKRLYPILLEGDRLRKFEGAFLAQLVGNSKNSYIPKVGFHPKKPWKELKLVNERI